MEVISNPQICNLARIANKLINTQKSSSWIAAIYQFLTYKHFFSGGQFSSSMDFLFFVCITQNYVKLEGYELLKQEALCRNKKAHFLLSVHIKLSIIVLVQCVSLSGGLVFKASLYHFTMKDYTWWYSKAARWRSSPKTGRRFSFQNLGFMYCPNLWPSNT